MRQSQFDREGRTDSVLFCLVDGILISEIQRNFLVGYMRSMYNKFWIIEFCPGVYYKITVLIHIHQEKNLYEIVQLLLPFEM